MLVKTKKTWSQQQLTNKLLDQDKEHKSFLSREHAQLLIHATKTALAAALCWYIAVLLGMHDGYWGSISAIIVLQSNFGATMTASRDRILGTIMGALIGYAFMHVSFLPWNFMMAIITAVVLCGLFNLRSSSRLAGVTIAIVMLVQSTIRLEVITLHRVFEVLLGIATALIFATVVFPDRARLALKDGLAQEFLILNAFFTASLKGLGGEPAPDLEEIRSDVFKIMRSNNHLLESSRNEPSGGPGWREGLGMLSQFGRSIFDALIALDMAVRDSQQDDYGDLLEPELSRLANDISSGFIHVASCIHQWKFNVPPPGMNLEADIVALEARMNAVRPKGAEFSQAEVLRGYAIQLHLKQLARKLRASRVETSRAIGEASAPKGAQATGL